jgi:hypothetical protein
MDVHLKHIEPELVGPPSTTSPVGVLKIALGVLLGNVLTSILGAIIWYGCTH